MTQSQILRTILKNEFSPKQYYSQFKSKWHHILLGGTLDALTTLIALSVFSMSELNPLINHLFPDHVHFIPFVLVEMTFIRYIVVSVIFKKSKYLNWAVYFTLYFLPVWNIINILHTLI